MSEISINRKHDFPHDVAKKAATRMADELKDRFDLTGHWKGDELHFRGSGIDGVLKLAPHAVQIDVELGFLLALMKPVIEASIHENLDRLFAAGHKAGKAEPKTRAEPKKKPRK